MLIKTCTVIDRFSRRIIWLKVGITNKDPKPIAWFFLQAVESVGGMYIYHCTYTSCLYMHVTSAGCPKLLRCDMGSENANIAFIQPFIRRNHSDARSGSGSFRYGKSTTNQVSRHGWELNVD